MFMSDNFENSLDRTDRPYIYVAYPNSYGDGRAAGTPKEALLKRYYLNGFPLHTEEGKSLLTDENLRIVLTGELSARKCWSDSLNERYVTETFEMNTIFSLL